MASTVVVTAVDFFSDDRDVSLRRIKRIGLPGEPDRRHVNLSLELACGTSPDEPEMPGRVIVLHGLTGRFPDHLEAHSCWSGKRIQRWPSRLIDDRDVLHFQCQRVAIRTDCEATLQNRNDPVESRRRNGRVKIVYLVCRDRRSPEQRQSYMREGALLRSSRAPILSLHHAVVGRRTAKSDAVSLVVGAGGLRKTAQSNCRSPRNAGPKSVIVLLCVSTPTISQFQTCRTKLCRPTFVFCA